MYETASIGHDNNKTQSNQLAECFVGQELFKCAMFPDYN